MHFKGAESKKTEYITRPKQQGQLIEIEESSGF
jgi:hypothetical protein